MSVFGNSRRNAAMVTVISALAACAEMEPPPPPPPAVPATSQQPNQTVNSFTLMNHVDSTIVTFITLTPHGGWSANWLSKPVPSRETTKLYFQPHPGDGCYRQFTVTAQSGRRWSGNANLCTTGLIDVRVSGVAVR